MKILTLLVAAAALSAAEPPSHCGLDAFPFPRPYAQVVADAAERTPTTSLQLKMCIADTGAITHLRFTRLSTEEAVNRYAYRTVRK